MRLKIAEDIGYWELPKPPKGREKEWHTVVRLGNTNKGIPYGYSVCYDNDGMSKQETEETKNVKEIFKAMGYT